MSRQTADVENLVSRLKPYAQKENRYARKVKGYVRQNGIDLCLAIE